MRSTWFYLLFFLNAGIAFGQPSPGKDTLANMQKDSNYVKALMKAASYYYFSKPDSCLILSTRAYNLASEINFKSGQVSSLNAMSESNRFMGDYPEAIRLNLLALELSREMKDSLGIAGSLGFIGLDYIEFREYRQALSYLFESSVLNRKVKNQVKEVFDISNISNAYDYLEKPDSALFYGRLALNRFEGINHGPLKTLILTRVGNAFAALKNGDSALYYYQAAFNNMQKTRDRVNGPKIQREIAEYYESAGQYDSSLFYARQAIVNGSLTSQRLELFETSKLLTRLFRRQNAPDSALFYQDIEKAMMDSLYGFAKIKRLQLLMLGEQKKQQDILQQQQHYKTRSKMIALLSAVAVLLLVGILLYRNNRHKQKANLRIEKAYDELKSTQAQLIQSEKMASLGALTAGIAHEIQNPLNFVNNFSELNNELIREMRAELESGKINDAIRISSDLEANESKILEHGKRADAIVKSMLQHSRTGTGKKEMVDINALVDEYLRLAYQGWRAKDNSLSAGQAGFKARFETEYDPSIGKISIVPQDIARVILNLINNAFYAVNEKNSDPAVLVITKKERNKILIIIVDNGKGIPQKILEKIFQPFFTTKPAGRGTGLGLSLSYDIIKAHNGDIQVKSELGKGAEFTISLPVHQH